MRINILNSFRHLSNTENRIRTSLERLSSGLRINGARDDAVGISISAKIRSQLSKVSTGIDNLNDAISILRTADSSMCVINSLLLRMRELILSSSNEVCTDLDREIYFNEISQILEEIDGISKRTTYNEKSLLNYSSPEIFFLKGKEFLESIKLEYASSGEYDIRIIDKGNSAKISLPFSSREDITKDTYLYSALGETLSEGYKKFLYIYSDNKTAEVELDISPYNGDTVETAVNKINMAFLQNGMNISAYYDLSGKQIVLSSNEPGTRNDIKINEINSIEGAKNFSDITEVIGLKTSQGQLSYNRLLFIEGAVEGLYINGSTLVRSYFQTMEPITFTFKGFGGNSVTFSIPDTYTLDSASLYIENQLRTNLGIDLDVSFNEITDSFIFIYSNPNERLEVYIDKGIHNETYESIKATEDTLLGNILDLNDELSISFVDITGIVGSLTVNKSTTIGSLIEGINNLNIGITAYLDNDMIRFDQTGRTSKIYDIIQVGSAIFNVEKANITGSYPVLEPPRDIVISVNGRLYTSNSREFIIDGISIAFTKDALDMLSEIQFRVFSSSILIWSGDEYLDLQLPEVNLNSLGLNTLSLDDSNSALEKVDRAIDIISRNRARLGSIERMIGDIIQSKEIYKVNLTEAEARILYADIMEEISKLSKDKLLLILCGELIRDESNLLRETILSLLR